MAENDYLDFNIDSLPEQFEHDIDGVTYTMMLYYNDSNDSFYIDLYDSNTPPVPIVMGERLVYGMNMWGSINDPRLPAIQLVPIDDDGNETTVDSLNFTDTVQLEFVDTEVDADDGNNYDDDSEQDINQPDYADGPDDDVKPYASDPTRGVDG